MSAPRPIYGKIKKVIKCFHPDASMTKCFKRHCSEGGPKAAFKRDVECFYCQNIGHLKKDCIKLKAHLEQNKSGGSTLPKSVSRVIRLSSPLASGRVIVVFLYMLQ